MNSVLNYCKEELAKKLERVEDMADLIERSIIKICQGKGLEFWVEVEEELILDEPIYYIGNTIKGAINIAAKEKSISIDKIKIFAVIKEGGLSILLPRRIWEDLI